MLAGYDHGGTGLGLTEFSGVPAYIPEWGPQRRSWYIPAGVDQAGFGEWLHEAGGERRKTSAGRETAARDEKLEAIPATAGTPAEREERHPGQADDPAQNSMANGPEGMDEYIAEGVSRMKARAHRWSTDKRRRDRERKSP